MSPTTTPTTPLTDTEVAYLGKVYPPSADVFTVNSIRERAAAEIRALRAERDDLLAALRRVKATNGGYICLWEGCTKDRMWGGSYCPAHQDAAIARAEGRAEG